jgi:hypothetical protein
MSRFEFCIPTPGKTVPSGTDWFHEVKYDGYRLRVERQGKSVRLITRGGHDWTKRFPWIAEAALKSGEAISLSTAKAVVLCLHGLPDFNALHSGKHNSEVQFCAFDVLALDCRYQCARPISNGYCVEGRMGFSSTRLRLTRSVPIFFTQPAPWASRNWSRSGAIANTEADGHLIGSRSRTERTL